MRAVNRLDSLLGEGVEGDRL